MAAQTTFWNFRRFSRWMMIGTDTAASPNSMMGLRKDMIRNRRAFGRKIERGPRVWRMDRNSKACGSSLRSGAQSKGQIPAQDFVQRLGGVDEQVMALVLFAAAPDPRSESFHLTQVTFANLARPGHELRNILEPFEFHQASERKL